MAIELDIDQFERLIAANDFAGAKKLLDEVTDQQLSEAERGEIYTKISSAYLKASHEINKEYIKNLDDAIELLEKANKAEKLTDEKIKLAEVKLNLLKDSQ
ncbi:MAG: hypothetical protein V4664_01830 [Patescibacteria group bacterium]